MHIDDLEARLRATLPMAHLEVVDLPDCPPLKLALIGADFPEGPLPREVMHGVIEQPAYWAFCWGSGLVLARYLLMQPSWVQGKTVVDLGCGSGVVAIAAALAGAARVCACDTDSDARAATALNAAINGTRIEVCDTLPAGSDVLLMADVLYDQENLPLLELAQARAAEVLVADTRITRLPIPGYQEIARLDARTHPNLGEFDEFKTAHIFHWARAPG